jgi:hypothetical protein
MFMMRVTRFATVVSVMALLFMARAQVVERELFHDQMTTETFLNEYFDRSWLLLRRYNCLTDDGELDLLHNDSTPSCLGFQEDVSARLIAAQLIGSQPQSAFQLRGADSKLLDASVLFDRAKTTEAIVDDVLSVGNSIVYKPELATEDSIIDLEINVALEQLLKVAISTHVYISSQGINALKPHTDVSAHDSSQRFLLTDCM